MEEQLTRLEAKIDVIAEGQVMLREEFKQEIRILDGNLRQEIEAGDQALRHEIQAGNQALRQSLLHEMHTSDQTLLEGLRQEIHTVDQALRGEMRDLGESLRQEIHTVHLLYEDTKSDIRAVAEAVVTLGERVDRGFIEQRELYDRRVEPIEAVVRQSSATRANHEQRLTRLEQHRKR